jgi:hypothetical protein
VKDFRLGFPVQVWPNGKQPKVENQKQMNDTWRKPYTDFLHDALALEEN